MNFALIRLLIGCGQPAPLIGYANACSLACLLPPLLAFSLKFCARIGDFLSELHSTSALLEFFQHIESLSPSKLLWAFSSQVS